MARDTEELDPVFEIPEQPSPERALCAEVLHTALLDATAPLVDEARRWHKPPRGAVKRSDQTRARLWILDGARRAKAPYLTFELCCSAVNLDPDQVRAKVLEDPRALWLRLRAEGSLLSARRRTRKREK